MHFPSFDFICLLNFIPESIASVLDGSSDGRWGVSPKRGCWAGATRCAIHISSHISPSRVAESTKTEELVAGPGPCLVIKAEK